MRYAIDRYDLGSEKEVCADDFDGQYIQRRHNRFYCPECGEIVFFRAKGGNNPNHFYHQEKTDSTPECDKRVDGRSNLSLSERVGLPVYLKPLGSKRFQLNIGFPAIGSEMLEQASLANYTVEISSEAKYRTIKVDTTNFFEDEVSLIPVNFIPSNGRNYTITTHGDKNVLGLHRKWSNYADGFTEYGAIFSYDETWGKKVRRNDSISTNRSYYVVTKRNLRDFPKVQQTYIGKLDIGQTSYEVYKVEIKISTDDKVSFSSVRDYFKQYFGVWLLEYPPELVPIWPPVIQQQDYLIPVTNNKKILCAISSGNAHPNVYSYSEYGVEKINKNINDYNGVKTIEVVSGKRPVTLSVDIKYVGREVSFLSKSISESKYYYETDIKNKSTVLSWDNINEKVLSSEFSFVSNSRMELYIGSKGKIFRHISIREQSTPIPPIKNSVELYLITESVIIRQVKCVKETEHNINYEKLVTRLHEAKMTQMISIPRWAEYTIRTQRNFHNNFLFNSIVSTIKNGQIPIGVLKLLRTAALEENNIKSESGIKRRLS